MLYTVHGARWEQLDIYIYAIARSKLRVERLYNTINQLTVGSESVDIARSGVHTDRNDATIWATSGEDTFARAPLSQYTEKKKYNDKKKTHTHTKCRSNETNYNCMLRESTNANSTSKVRRHKDIKLSSFRLHRVQNLFFFVWFLFCAAYVVLHVRDSN